MSTRTGGLLRVGPLTDLERNGCAAVTGAGHTIVVFAHDGVVYALDNRCPHMGFPLNQGSVQNGILTCHWHHARFDLASGNTFDLFAGDAPSFPVYVINGEVYVDPNITPADPVAEWSHRLDEGLEHNIQLVVARSVIGMMGAGADYRLPLEKAALFGVRNSDRGWDSGLSILTACANILPWLSEDDRPRALYQGILHVAQQTSGRPQRFPIAPLGGAAAERTHFKEWFRRFVQVRDAEAAERALRTAIDLGLGREEIADVIFSAITDHLWVDTGHTLDFANKAFELLDHIGWGHAPQVLTSLVPQIVSASRGEESSVWRHPIDVASLVFVAREDLPALRERGSRAGPWTGEPALVETLLQDDPAAAVDALKNAVASGATHEELGAAVAYAAFLRMARFHTSNEFSDWNTVHHTVTTANALHRALRRTPTNDLLRAVFDTALAVYHARFLNIPSAALPGPNGRSNGAGPAEAIAGMLDLFDRQQQVPSAARQVASYLDSGAPDEDLLATLGHAVMREDAGFHQFQLIEAAFQQYAQRRGTPEGRVILIAAARFLAAHFPTVRSVGQTYNTAFRLHRGDQIFQEG